MAFPEWEENIISAWRLELEFNMIMCVTALTAVFLKGEGKFKIRSCWVEMEK